MGQVPSGSGIFHISGKLESEKSNVMKFLCNHPETKVELQKWAGTYRTLYPPPGLVVVADLL